MRTARWRLLSGTRHPDFRQTCVAGLLDTDLGKLHVAVTRSDCERPALWGAGEPQEDSTIAVVADVDYVDALED